MRKWCCRLTALRLTLVTSFLCICGTFIVMIISRDFDNERPEEKATRELVTCNRLLQDCYSQKDLEILSLKERIKSLEVTIETIKREGHDSVNQKHILDPYVPECAEQLALSKKLAKTEVENGLSFNSESLVTSFVYFTSWYEYSPKHGNYEKISNKVVGFKRVEIDQVIDTSIISLNSNTSGLPKWRRDHFFEGIYRHFDSVGTHYELYFINDEGTHQKVISFRPAAPPLVIGQKKIIPTKSVNIILPLTSDRLNSFKLFLNQLDTLVKKRLDLFLTLVFYDKTIVPLLDVFQSFVIKKRFKSYQIHHIPDKPFSRGEALDYAIRRITGKRNPLIFLCDVDVIFNEEFLRRCKANTQVGKRVYYPIVFSLYNPEVIEKYFAQKFPSWKDQLKVTSEHGFWRGFGYGMACMYRSDYVTVGGFDLAIQGWGEEDVLLFRKFARSNITIIRSADPDIFHMWHHKTCNESLSDEQYRGCIKSKIINEGSQLQLGYRVFSDEIKLRRRARQRI